MKFEKKIFKQAIDDMSKIIDSMKGEENIHIIGKEGLKERLDKNILQALTDISSPLIEAIRDREYERNPYLGDDFIPDTALYNVIGAIYSLLPREQKDEALGAYLNQFDRIRYDMVQLNHTSYIREPSLLADICIARHLYWPGLHDEESLWEGKTKFSDLQKEIIGKDGLFKTDKVNSDFLVAYALIRTDLTSFGEDYIKIAHPDFLERVIKGITALRFGGNNPSKINKGQKRLKEILPKSIHDKVEQFRLENEWVDPKKFE